MLRNSLRNAESGVVGDMTDAALFTISLPVTLEKNRRHFNL
jgi:hypothetical protein